MNIGKLEEFVEQLRLENNELHQRLEEAGEEFENIASENKALKTQVELKEDTIENLKSKLNAFAADAKKGVREDYAGWQTAGRL